MKQNVLSTSLLLACLVACEEPLVDLQVVTNLRVLGAQVLADEDPESSVVEPGASGTVRWLIASDRSRDYTALSVLCRARPTTRGVIECDRELAQERVSGTAPSVEAFAIDTEGLDGGESWMVWLGVCRKGEPRFSAKSSTFSCSGGAEAVVSYLRPNSEVERNNNPKLEDDLLRLDGDTWDAPESYADPGDSCDPVLPELFPGTSKQINFELTEDDRESLPGADSYGAYPAESLIFSHVASAEGLEAPFSVIEHDSKKPGFELELRPPEDSPARDGQTADFYLIVRDERGGTDWLRRQYCLQP